jgi:two-component sensor histidine kinase
VENRVLNKLLSRYDTATPTIRLKARFLTYMCLAMLVCIPLAISYTVYLHLHNPLYNYSIRWNLVIPEVAAVILVFAISIINIRGHFTMASQLLYMVLFATFWMVMFTDRSAVVGRLDTISYMLALLSMTPLVVQRRGWLVFLYAALNLGMLYAFMFLNRENLGIPVNSFWDYLADNTMAFLFMAVAVYNILSINRRALEETEESSRRYIRKNEELEATNEELQATMEELEATNEQLETTNQQLMESNRNLEKARERITESEQDYRELSSFNERLNEIFIFFTEAESVEQLYERIAGSFRLLTGAVAASSSRHDASEKKLRVVSVAADEGVMEQFMKTVGEPAVSMEMDIPDAIIPVMLSQVFLRVDSLDQISFGKISRSESERIMNFLGVREIVLLALHYGSELAGSTAAYLGENSNSVPDQALKTFAYMAGLAITRKRSETALTASLHEKEILLKEVHHRVKNNLQIIISLLNMQAMRLGDEKLTGLFADSSNRIRSMAKIHEKLYGARDLSGINFADYLMEMSRDLCSAQLRDGRKMRIDFDTEKIMLGVKEAIPCGLILNEILTNAFKHAFPDGFAGEPELRALLHRRGGGRVEMTIRDNGIGIDEAILAADNKSMGLFLIRILVKQIDGELQVSGDGGTCYRIIFPLDAPKI